MHAGGCQQLETMASRTAILVGLMLVMLTGEGCAVHGTPQQHQHQQQQLLRLLTVGWFAIIRFNSLVHITRSIIQ